MKCFKDVFGEEAIKEEYDFGFLPMTNQCFIISCCRCCCKFILLHLAILLLLSDANDPQPFMETDSKCWKEFRSCLEFLVIQSCDFFQILIH